MFIENAIADTDTIALQETVVEPQAPTAIGANWWGGLAQMLLIFIVFYFLLIRPQEKKRRQQEQLVSGVKKGEEVLTNAGFFGTVTKINDSDNTIMVQIAKDIEIKVLKNSVADIVSRNAKVAVKETEKTPNKKKKK